MSAEKITSRVETIGIEAEKIIKEARSKANEVLLKAGEKANQILSSGLPMDEIRADCEQIIRKAREEANRNVEDSKEKASGIRAGVGKQVEEITKRIVNIIIGAKTR